MQLFHELKQKFPGVPDHVVSNTIELYCHDKHACESHLHSEAKASLTHAYHAPSSAASRQSHDLKVDAPVRCRNQPIIKHEAPIATAVTICNSQEPQTATHTFNSATESKDVEDKIKNELNTDANQNLVEVKNVEEPTKTPNSSPTTVINLDNCVAKFSTESPSDVELTNDGSKSENNNGPLNIPSSSKDRPEFVNYKILRSNKIKNLNERLERGKEKKVVNIKKEETPKLESSQEKPKRPCTLEFLKPNPDIAFKQKSQEPSESCRSVSPANKPEPPSRTQEESFWQDRGYPLNLSVNVNCHMDLGRGYSDWLEDFDSPRAITSLNLTVCTPTSSMASPVRDRREEDGGFESHFTVTVSPSTIRPPPRRKAPPPPPTSSPGQPTDSQRIPSRTSVDSTSGNGFILYVYKLSFCQELPHEYEKHVGCIYP